MDRLLRKFYIATLKMSSKLNMESGLAILVRLGNMELCYFWWAGFER